MNTYYEQEERPMSRSEKIREAKSAFSQSSYGRSSYSRSSYGRENDSVRMGVTDGRGEQLSLEKGKHHFGMLRMVMAGVLFFVLLLSFHLKLSYQGYDRAYVEQALSDNAHWDSLVNQVSQVMKQVMPEMKRK